MFKKSNIISDVPHKEHASQVGIHDTKEKFIPKGKVERRQFICVTIPVVGSKLDPDQKHEDGRNEVQVYCSKAISK